MLPRPTLSRAPESFWPRPIQLSSTEHLLDQQTNHCRRAPLEYATSMVYAAVRMGLGMDCDWTATSGVTRRPSCRFRRGRSGCRRLEFAAFSVKSMAHDSRG